MFQFQSFIQRLVGTSYEADDYGYPRCVVPPVEIVQTENSTVKRDKALTHLVRLNHHTHSVLYTGDKKFLNHNHVPHVRNYFPSRSFRGSTTDRSLCILVAGLSLSIRC